MAEDVRTACMAMDVIFRALDTTSDQEALDAFEDQATRVGWIIKTWLASFDDAEGEEA